MVGPTLAWPVLVAGRLVAWSQSRRSRPRNAVAGSGSGAGTASTAVHFLFSPWLLVAVAIVARIKFRPRSSRR